MFSAAFAQAGQLDKRVGEPVDIAPWAYEWRSDREVQTSAEAYFIPRRLERIDTVYRTARTSLPADQLKSIYYDMPDVLRELPAKPKGKLAAALLWTGGVTKSAVTLKWPGGDVPAKDKVEVRIYPTAFGWFGWTVDQILRDPEISKDGRTWTYHADPNAKMDTAYSQHIDAATEMVAVFCEDADAVPTIGVTSDCIGKWKRIDVEVDGVNFDEMRVERYVALTGAMTKTPRGMTIEALWAPDARLGLDSRLTFWTKDGGFTVALRDVERGPVFIPRRHVTVRKVGDTSQPATTQKSIVQMTREHREAESWDELMREARLWTCPPGTQVKPPPAVDDPPMRVELPDAGWTNAWRAAADQLRGKHMWGGLAFEVGRVAHEMELIGLHDEAARIYEHFLAAPGAKSDGDYSDGNGALELATSMRHDMGYSHDGTHASTGRLLFAMAERYFLTGDRAWLEKNRPRLQAAADWIVRQRREYMRDIPNRDKLFALGLMPPQMLGDYALPSCDWHWYYCDNAFALQGLSRFADALAAIDRAAASATYRAEAEAFRSDLRRAVKREAILAPVRLGRDGAHHTYLPRSAYMRGLTGPEVGAPQFPECDRFMGALPLAEPLVALDACDGDMVETLDLMEEMAPDLVTENEAARKAKGLPSEDAWFWTCHTRLPKASHNANVYLLRDDVPNFLRFWQNGYAAMVGANGKFWETWSLGNFKDCDNPDNGTAGWFLENFRNLLVMEDGPRLLIARATPRAWLEQGKRIRLQNAPTYFGVLGYEITSDVDHGAIAATIDVPTRRPAEAIVLRLRHPTAMAIKSVTIDNKPSSDFDAAKETITIRGASGCVRVVAKY